MKYTLAKFKDIITLRVYFMIGSFIELVYFEWKEEVTIYGMIFSACNYIAMYFFRVSLQNENCILIAHNLKASSFA